MRQIFLVFFTFFLILNTQKLRADGSDHSFDETTPSNSTEKIEEATPDSTLNAIPEVETKVEPTPQPEPITVKKSFTPFAGKVTKSRVRMRLNPSLEAPIIRELNSNDLVVVVGENEDFYAIEPPADIKGYIYRTYVLDGVVEGNHVNVRLEPDTTAPVIAQMNSGEAVNGSVSFKDKKWIEITPPNSTRFYISKEYIKNAGDPSIITLYNNRKREVLDLLTTANLEAQVEFKKPYSEINIDQINANLTKIITEYSDFPEEVSKAKDLLTSVQTGYMNKRLSDSNEPSISSISTETTTPTTTSENIQVERSGPWVAVEEELFKKWNEQNGSQFDLNAFYESQEDKVLTLIGTIEPYNRNVKNKPGDYLLVSLKNHMPLAYLYSTQVNLQDKVGKQVTIKVLPRDNHHFAYPAYFVLSAN